MPAEGTERLEFDAPHLVVGCGCVEAEDTVFRITIPRTGGLLYMCSNGDEDVLR